MGGWVIPRKMFESEFVSSQIWCYAILNGWNGGQLGGLVCVVPRNIFQSKFLSRPRPRFSCFNLMSRMSLMDRGM